MKNDTNHENNKISKLKLYQYDEGISVSNGKTVERAGRTNRDMEKATTQAKRRSKLQLKGQMNQKFDIFYFSSILVKYV